MNGYVDSVDINGRTYSYEGSYPIQTVKISEPTLTRKLSTDTFNTEYRLHRGPISETREMGSATTCVSSQEKYDPDEEECEPMLLAYEADEESCLDITA